MANFLDIGLLNNFSSIFVFLLVFVGVYGLFEKTKILGENKKPLNSMLGLVTGIFVVLSNKAVAFIVFVLPWFFIIGMILILFIFIGKMFGKTDKDVAWAFTWNTSSPVITWVIIVVVIILFFGFSHVFGQELLEDNPEFNGTANEAAQNYLTNQTHDVNTGDYSSNSLATLIHPKVLGMVVILLIGMIAMLLITKSGFVGN